MEWKNPYRKVIIEEMPSDSKAADEYLSTYQIIIYVDTLKNELAKESPPAFEDQTLDKTDAKRTNYEAVLLPTKPLSV